MADRRFEAIAIVGRGCVLPGALTPDALWQAVVEDRDLLTPAPPGKFGVTDSEQVAMGYRGGFVTGFDAVFDPSAHDLGDLDPARLDPLFQWLLHAGREAWLEAGAPKTKRKKLGVIAGNLGYPNRALSDFAADIWETGQSGIERYNRFNTGGPARLLARALGAKGPAFALDAACASSLYAVKLACDRLQDGSLDVAVAAAVNGADNLILHQGFSALNALSPTGRSRPFVKGADGLVPAEGAAALVLKRLSDCEAGEIIYGVIRGIGLSNDGRRKSLLAPDEGGQAEAMVSAWAMSGLDPASDIGLVEAHATGTPTGDKVELAATAQHFAGVDALPIGSLKGNLGHLITAAGMASLIKMSFAINEGVIPPTRLDGDVLDAFAGSNVIPASKHPWPEDRPRIAAVSNFGFGGNNAHLIVAADTGERPKARKHKRLKPEAVICSAGFSMGPDRGVAAVLQRLSRPPKQPRGPMREITAQPKRLRTPPSELGAAQGQQLALYDAVDEALDRHTLEDGARVGVFAGFACSPEATRWMLRARIAERLHLDPDTADAARDGIAPALKAGDVLGAMPNVSANRINVRGDWRAMGFAVMEEEASGLRALELAMRALDAGEIDAAIVAAGDLSADPVHEAATGEDGGDAAVALVLKRAGEGEGPTLKSLKMGAAEIRPSLLETLYGISHAAGGLARLAVEAELTRRSLTLKAAGLAPNLSEEPHKLTVPGGSVKLKPSPRPAPDLLRPAPLLETYAAETPQALARAITIGQQGTSGPCRIAFDAPDETTLETRRKAAIDALTGGQPPEGEGLHYGAGEAAGALAFVFTGAAAAYSGMGQGLFAAFPELGAMMRAKFPAAQAVARLLASDLSPAFDQLRATTLISQAQHLLLTDWLGLKPTVAMGLSSGETNSLIAFNAWSDADGLMETIGESGMYTDDLAGEFRTAKMAWSDDTEVTWETWRVRAAEADIRAAIETEPRCDLTILYSPDDGVISGDAAACQRVLKRLGGQGIRVPHDLVVHTPMMASYAETWHRLHHRKTKAPKGVRVYANATNAAYEPDADTVADMLTGQAVAEINFPKTLARARADGVRTFIEIGPRDTLTHAIRETLGADVQAVACDRFGQPALQTLTDVAATVFAAGHAIDIGRLKARLTEARANAIPLRTAAAGEVTFPAHAPLPELPRRAVRKSLTRPEAKALKPFTPPAPKPATGRTLPMAPDSTWKPPAPRPAGATTLLERPAAAPSSVQRSAPKPAPAAKPSVRPLERREPVGPNFSRDQLEAAAAGYISEIFGEAFAAQDKFRRQVRMPRPPMLLCDRITGIDAEALVQGKGTIWTETDVSAGHWAVSDGMLRPGPLIEAGQADLALISWMGADMLNCSDRVYRLLGCELTFHEGGLPRVGETVRFQISIKGHAELSGVRMFFFEYDGYADDRLVLSVRNGQAGFFTDEELANSKGVLWDAETDGAPTAEPVLDHIAPTAKRAFSANEVAAFRAGDTFRCFGDGFERAAPHTRPARLPDGRLALFDEIETFDPDGGPWRRGYLTARQSVPADAWFYDGHFHEDPCMPGTLMAEAAVQALEFTAAALGLTIDRDSHVFEPVPGEAATFYCRGQVVPDTDHDVTYEVFVDEVIDGEEPVVFASLLARSDGRKVFYCPRFGVRLRRQWPEMKKAANVPHYVNDECDVRGDEAAMLECGSGAPSNAFGSMYAPFDTKGTVPRLPQPPYHMVSRVLSVDGPSGQQTAGLTAIAEYDVPPDAWYFAYGGSATMPFSVLTEVILQPCGWLASYSGFALSGETRFRNLDGKGTTARQIHPDDGTIRTRTTLTRCSRIGPMTIVFFELEATLAYGTPVVTMETSFGFFTKASLASQAGLKASDEARAFLNAPADPPSEAGTLLPASSGRLELLDLIDRFEPTGGAAGLGRIRARQSVDPYAWYFRAHFFSDPVQPGSLGLDMLVQLLARAADLKGLGEAFDRPVWDPIAPGKEVSWTYRGQVTPAAKQVTATVEIDRVETRDEETIVLGTGSLWVDGLRIYEMRGLSIRLRAENSLESSRNHTFLIPSFPGWVGAHRPTHTVPALPLLAQAGMLLRQAFDHGSATYPIEINNFSARKWADVPENGLLAEASVNVDGAAQLRGRRTADPDAPMRLLSAGQIVSRTRPPAPRLTAADHGPPRPDPYQSADLFHGPGLQPIVEISRDSSGFEATVDLSLAAGPGDPFDPVILDALVHGPPHETPEEWFDGVEDCAIYPVRIERLIICSDLPETGHLTIRGVPGQRDPATGNLPVTIEAYLGKALWARLDLIEKAYPKGPLASLNPLKRRDFLTVATNENPAPLSQWDGTRTRLSPADVIACDWLPGTVAAAWGCGDATGSALVKAVAIKEHFARKWGLHPARITLDPPFVIGPKGRARYALSFDSVARAWAVQDDAYE